MDWKKMFRRKKFEPVRTPIPRPIKKEGCKIRFKKTTDGEVIDFSPSCKLEQIEAAKRMREESREE